MRISSWPSYGIAEDFYTLSEAQFLKAIFQKSSMLTSPALLIVRLGIDGYQMPESGPLKGHPDSFLLAASLIGSITDRRDFYHQAQVTAERAQTNMLPFWFKDEELVGCKALEIALEREKASKRSRRSREAEGDGFGHGLFGEPGAKRADGWYPCFSSLFQGDHLGVEYALLAHEGVLSQSGMLQPSFRVKGHGIFPTSRRWEALIIDDYFAIGAEPAGSSRESSFAWGCLQKARDIYDQHGILGSAEKDVEAQCVFKAAGAEINSSDQNVRQGLTTVGAPLSKRIALATLSLRAARLPMTSTRLLVRLAGSWASVLLYRRCLSSIVEKLFSEAAARENEVYNSMVPLSRSTANELCLLSALAPIAVSNLAVDYSTTLYASDASMGKGAYVKTEITDEVSEVLWLGSDKRGCYTRLDGPAISLLAAAGEEVHDLPSHGDGILPEVNPKKSPLLDFVEFYGGSGRISKIMNDMGFSVAPPLDLSASRHFDMSCPRLLEWCLQMIESKRIRSFLSEPPCTSFSAAAFPDVRSYAQPEGYDRLDPKTWLGNLLAFRSFILLRHRQKHGAPCGKEQPRLSKMAWMRAWKRLLELGFEESVLASCQFGSIHKKEFRFITYLLDSTSLQVKCPGGHERVKIEGAYTRPSAIYTWDLAKHVAKHFARALLAQRGHDDDAAPTTGIESALVNDLLASSHWQHGKTWRWKRNSHINVLEANGGLAVLKDAAEVSQSCRINCLLDSRVAKGALAKGRTSSKTLTVACKRSAAIQVAGDIYPGWNFAPTRLNVADDPTRDAFIREPVLNSWWSHFTPHELQAIHATGLSRWAANWIRLFILLQLTQTASAFEHDLHHLPSIWTFTVSWISDHVRSCIPLVCSDSFASWNFASFLWNLLSFIASILSLFLVLAPISWILTTPRVVFSVGRFCLCPLGWTLVVSARFSVADAMLPTTAAERSRAEARGLVCPIPTRVARQKTLESRRKLLEDFRIWLFQCHGVMLQVLLTAKPPDAEEVTHWLILYGQAMYLSGKAYGKFAETVNSIAAARPVLRKQLTGAWDFCFAWLTDEPSQHHPALPLSILLAVMSLSMLWGWPVEAAIFGLTWSGICRIGEVLLATREDLILPSDASPGTRYALLRISTPKTRGRAARHQAARVDYPDIIALLTAVFQNFPVSEKLWALSAATLRKRLTSLLAALGLPTSRRTNSRPFDLGSFRPGGATHLLLLTEDSELVRRRGRWVTTKVMEVYLQEVLYSTCTEKLPADVRTRVQQLAGAFPLVLRRAVQFLETGIPHQVWHRLFQAEDTNELGEEGSDGCWYRPAFALRKTAAGEASQWNADGKREGLQCA